MKKLNNKFAIVTGAAGLLGVEHSKALIDIGATVFLADIDIGNIKVACEKLGPNAIPLYLDVTSESSVQSALADTKKYTKNIHILINNAAINPKMSGNTRTSKETSRFENFEIEDWEMQVRVGLTGAFVLSKAVGAEMLLSGEGGVMLNIASDLSVIAPDQRLYKDENASKENQPVKPVTYSVIKTGLIGLTRYLAAYWAEDNIRVNALSPGGVYNNHSKEFTNRINKLIPMGRMAEKGEYRGAIQFLCSDDSSYMTGQNIVIDGGRTII